MDERSGNSEDLQLDDLFQQYRQACPDVEPSANFMPLLWKRIDSQRTLWFHFGRLGKNVLALSGALCLLLLGLNLTAPPQVATNYADALLTDESTEQAHNVEVPRPLPPEPGGSRSNR